MDTLAGRSRRLRLLGASAGETPFKSALRVILGVILLGSGALGAALFLSGPIPHSPTTPTIDGTWELASVGGTPVGPDSHSGVICQRLALRSGKIRGETLVSSVADGVQAKLPFPDDSVEKVIPNADETGYRVLWSGTYQMDEHRQLTLHLGSAVYFVKVDLGDSGQTLRLNQDIILTIPGAAQYRHAISARPHFSRHTMEPFMHTDR